MDNVETATPARNHSDAETSESKIDACSPLARVPALVVDAVESSESPDKHSKPDLIDDQKTNDGDNSPWSILARDKSSSSSRLNSNVNKKPGEYIMNLVFHSFATVSNRKIEQIMNGDKKVGC